jgi:hypothetical protein
VGESIAPAIVEIGVYLWFLLCICLRCADDDILYPLWAEAAINVTVRRSQHQFMPDVITTRDFYKIIRFMPRHGPSRGCYITF